MDRTTPVAHSEEIELYIRTYYSLLRSSGPIRVRSLEESHAGMNSSLHQFAESTDIDMSALVYCVMRLPDCMFETNLIVMGQMDHVFRRAGFQIESWLPVRARARRRKFYLERTTGTLAALIASVSDIDDLIPCLTTLQIEWNKIHQKLSNSDIAARLADVVARGDSIPGGLLEQVRTELEVSPEQFSRLTQIWPGESLLVNLHAAANSALDLRIRVLGAGLSDYRRSVQYWWRKIETNSHTVDLAEQPIYFVSSNVHSVVNLLAGLGWEYRNELLEFVQAQNPENLTDELASLEADDQNSIINFLYYASRLYSNGRAADKSFDAIVNERERSIGVTRVSDPHILDVEAQVIEIAKLADKLIDPRISDENEVDWDLLQASNAIIFNIDYPLGMAAYHVFSQVSTSVDRMLGVYLLGKAATLNGRVGDVMIPNVVYDEHSRNSYLFRNCFTAQDVAPFLHHGTVFDNQKAVTVRGTLLQNRRFVNVFYEEGYTDIEMEAGPYLSGVYEDIYPKRYPVNEIVNLFINAPYDIGLIHYASDTPISRHQTLLSKSLSYFGVDATYAATIAVLRRIFFLESERQKRLQKSIKTTEIG